MTVQRPPAIIFDWDNTLVDTWSIIHHALDVTFNAMGHRPWTLEEVRDRVRASARDTFPRLFGARAEHAMEIFYDAFERHHLVHLRALEGAEPMLEALQDSEILLTVLSNKKGELLRREADHLGWTPYFHRLVGANDAVRDKPAIESVEMALADSGVGLGPSVWFVGDTDMDMECALRAGCQPVLLRAEPPSPDEFSEPDKVWHISDPHSLLALLPKS